MAFSKHEIIGLILITLGAIWLGGGFVKTRYFEINLPTKSRIGTVSGVLLIVIGLLLLLNDTLFLQYLYIF